MSMGFEYVIKSPIFVCHFQLLEGFHGDAQRQRRHFRNSVLDIYLSILCGHVCALEQRSEDNFLYHVDPGNGPQVVRYDDKNL